MTPSPPTGPTPALAELSQAGDIEMFQQLRSALREMSRADAALRDAEEMGGMSDACAAFDAAADRAITAYWALVGCGVIGFLEDALGARGAA